MALDHRTEEGQCWGVGKGAGGLVRFAFVWKQQRAQGVWPPVAFGLLVVLGSEGGGQRRLEAWVPFGGRAERGLNQSVGSARGRMVISG